MTTEKRSHPRFTINEFIEIDYGHEKYINAEGVNISKNGILCKTDEECPLSSTVSLMMTLPYKKKTRIVSLEGMVNRSVHKRDKWETGISITSMSHASRTVFDEVMHQFNH